MITASNLIIKYTPFCEKATLCLTGKYHIGYWFDVYPDGRPVAENDTISKEDAQTMLEEYLSKLELPSGEWTENQKEALKSLMYYMQDTWADEDIKQDLEDKNFAAVRKKWELIRDNGPFSGVKQWKQEEINLFFGE